MTTTITSRSRWFVWLLAVVVLSRVPLLFGGYGADPDAWRVAYVAKKFWASGTYEVSRFPGYPLHELVSVLPIAVGGSFASNLFTLLCGLAVIVVWTLITRDHAIHPRLLAIAFAFTPLFWVNSATTLDYTWSLLFFLISFREALKGRGLSAGIMLGLAIGFRPSNAVLAVVPATALFLRPERWRSLTRFTAATLAVTTVSFLPVFMTYGIAGWIQDVHAQITRMNEPAPVQALLFGYRTVYAFGPLACAAVLILLVRGTRNLRDFLNPGNPVVVSSFCGIGAILILFFFLPLERAYLLPLLPLVLLIIDSVGSPKSLWVIVLCLVSFGLVNPDVIRHGGVRGTPGFNPRPGLVVEEIRQRQAALHRREFLSSYRFPEKTVVMTGAGPVFWVENSAVKPLPGQTVDDIRDVVVESVSQRNVLYTPILSKRDLDSLQTAGFNVVCVSDLREFIEKTAGYSMKKEGVRVLEVPGF